MFRFNAVSIRTARDICVAATLLLSSALLSPTPAQAEVPVRVPAGVWLMPLKVAVQIFDCDGLICGRVVWLQHPRDAAGQLLRDAKNPDPALRDRPLCGQTVIWGLTPAADPDHWRGGWLYNPEDGKTYRVKAELRADDKIFARIYLGVPLFGEDWTMTRTPLLSSEGWC